MNSNTSRQIIQLNKDFYKKVSSDFSKTRQSPWKGWGRVVKKIDEHFKDRKLINVLDVGCGNGRFYEYLNENIRDVKFKYTGLDINDDLLMEAKKKYDKASWKHYDVAMDLCKITEKYDLVVAFGITHHIPGESFRKKWFKCLADLVKPSGFLIFTTWNYDVDDRFKQKIVTSSEIELEDGDYLLGWGKSKAQRYVHIYSEDEIQAITNPLGLCLAEYYKSDGKNEQLNSYHIFENTRIH